MCTRKSLQIMPEFRECIHEIRVERKSAMKLVRQFDRPIRISFKHFMICYSDLMKKSIINLNNSFKNSPKHFLLKNCNESICEFSENNCVDPLRNICDSNPSLWPNNGQKGTTSTKCLFVTERRLIINRIYFHFPISMCGGGLSTTHFACRCSLASHYACFALLLQTRKMRKQRAIAMQSAIGGGSGGGVFKAHKYRASLSCLKCTALPGSRILVFD